MHDVCVPILYHDVDISHHNDGGLWASVYPGVQAESDNPDRSVEIEGPDPWHTVDELKRKQHAFIHTLVHNRHYGDFVKRFPWTYRTWEDSMDRHQGEGPIWKVFSAMRNISHLDFYSLTWEREIHAPPSLFPSARHIRLGGQMSYAMAKSILHSCDPIKVTRLELNNLQDFGQLYEGKDMPHVPYRCIPRDRGPETKYPNGDPKLKYPEPMRDHLRRRTGRCTALEYLILRGVGQEWRWHRSEQITGSAARDELRYQEWAYFIQSVKPTLQSLEFEQGLPPEDPAQGDYAPHQFPRLCPGRPMDQRFMKTLLPVLMSGPWPRLEKMVIRGLGGQVRRCNVANCPGRDFRDLEQAASLIEAALAPAVLSVCEREATRTFFIWHHRW